MASSFAPLLVHAAASRSVAIRVILWPCVVQPHVVTECDGLLVHGGESGRIGGDLESWYPIVTSPFAASLYEFLNMFVRQFDVDGRQTVDPPA